MLVIRGAVGQVCGMRMILCRACCMSLAGVCHSARRSVLGRARRRRVPGRVRCWNQRTRVSAQVTRASRARLVSRSVNGNRCAPLVLSRAMWSSTRAWARMSRSDSAASAVLSVQCPQ